MALQRTLLRRARAPAVPDYLVLGAGSAGSVIANRLVMEHGANVTLLEAGRSDRGHWDSWKVHMPAALTFNLDGDRYNWDYWTVPQRGLDGRRLHQPRGKVLGGSSSLNAMAYVRGHALDYERWAKEGAGENWSYKHVLPYFKKAQTHHSEPSPYRGSRGPLSVTRRRTKPVRAINEAFVNAGVEVGYKYSDDHNGFSQEGFGPMDMTVQPDGARASTANAYLRPLLNLGIDALRVVTGQHVTRLIFDSGSSRPRAVGVELVDSNGRVTEMRCKEEVIVSLGAVGSPVLLNHSGIGDPAELSEHNIDCRVALPDVGKNLQDHLEFYLQYLASVPCSLYPWAATFPGIGPLSEVQRYLFRQPWRAAWAGLQWFATGSGMSSSNHFEVGGFIRSHKGLEHPDIQYHFIPGCVVGQLDFLPQHGYQAHAGTLRPTSRGSIKIQSKDPRAAPLIDPAFLTTDQDVVDQRRSFRLTSEIMEAKAFAPFRKSRFSPEAADLTDDEVDAWVRQNSHSGYHLSCTCAMGRVVDGEGRVHGVDGLRVADASIMPTMTSGNLNAPTIMLAEKIADSIRGVQLPPEALPWYTPADWQSKQR